MINKLSFGKNFRYFVNFYFTFDMDDLIVNIDLPAIGEDSG